MSKEQSPKKHTFRGNGHKMTIDSLCDFVNQNNAEVYLKKQEKFDGEVCKDTFVIMYTLKSDEQKSN